MKIELKNVIFYEKLSEETSCFSADIVINNKKVGYCKNDGHGGCTYYHANSVEDRLIINEAEKYCLTLPVIKYSFGDIPMNLENKIDQLFEDWLCNRDKNRLENRLKKSMRNNLCIKNDMGYIELSWKIGNRKVTISEMLSTINGRNILEKAINKAKLDGKEILNTNIPNELK
jgi:hypothetical protein